MRLLLLKSKETIFFGDIVEVEASAEMLYKCLALMTETRDYSLCTHKEYIRSLKNTIASKNLG
jgi:hypothetical protein